MVGLLSVFGPWLATVVETQTCLCANPSLRPAAEQFTQEDPIGLAGGMNLYGFASGDPVNYADPLGLCRVQIGYKPVAPGAYHAYITTTAPDNTRTYFRGGPSMDNKAAVAGNASDVAGPDKESNYNSSRAARTGESPWGSIATRTGKYEEGTIDYVPGPQQTIVDDDDSCDKYNKSFAQTLAKIGAAHIPYAPTFRNSNSTVWELLRSAGLNVKPIVRAPGWDTRLFP